MPTNLEIKVRVPSLVPFRRRLLGLPHCRRLPILRQRDHYFHGRRGYLKLRVVSNGGAELIFYERARRRGARNSHYSKWPVADPGGLIRLLTSALGIDIVVRKTRQVFLVENARIHLDHVSGLGAFVEIEVMVRHGTTQARRLMDELLRTLHMSPGASVGVSYADLLKDHPVNRTGIF
jgi:predicted adenylyl cyclase CyaB